MPMGRFGGGGGGRSYGGGGGGGSSKSGTNQHARTAAATRPPSGFWFSSLGGSSKEFRTDPHRLYGDFETRCKRWKHHLEVETEGGKKKLDAFIAPIYHDYLYGCPDAPDLKKLSDFDENETSEDKRVRCFMVSGLLKVLKGRRELDSADIAFFKTWLDGCPDVPDFHS